METHFEHEHIEKHLDDSFSGAAGHGGSGGVAHTGGAHTLHVVGGHSVRTPQQRKIVVRRLYKGGGGSF